jgi:hypothetical protein
MRLDTKFASTDSVKEDKINGAVIECELVRYRYKILRKFRLTKLYDY